MPLRASIRGAACLLGAILLLAVPAESRAADDARIFGRVAGGAAGAALADAGVDLYRLNASSGFWTRSGFAWTDADGRFRFDGLPAEAYRVCAQSSAGIGPSTPDPLYLGRCWRAGAAVENADDIDVGPGATVRGITVRLPTRGQIRGLVTDPEGDAVTEGYARAFWRDGERWVAGPWAPFQDDGSYELRVAGAATYHVCFHPFETVAVATECWRDVPAVPSSTPIRGALPNRVVEDVDAELAQAGRISGVITGYPVGIQGSVSISALHEDEGEWWEVGWNVIDPWTSATPFELHNLPAGEYRVCFRSQDFEFVPVFPDECVGGTPTPQTSASLAVAAGEVTPGADVEVGLASRIRGRVTGISEPVPVQLLTASGEVIFERLTAANGSYAFADLPDGTYKVAFNRAPARTRLAARFYRNRAEHSGVGGATPVELGSGTVASGISGALVTGGSITGRIAEPSGAGLAGCRVRAHTLDGSLVTRWTESDALGGFDVGGLSTGSYLLAVDGGTCGIGRADLHYDAGAPARLTTDDAQADPIAVTLGSATAVPHDLVVTQVRNLVAPSIGGAPQAGAQLDAEPGTWAPADADLSYRWLADGAPIAGATGLSFTPGAGDAGARIRVEVRATSPGHTPGVRRSARTGPVAP